jgi:hypothetical protein
VTGFISVTVATSVLVMHAIGPRSEHPQPSMLLLHQHCWQPGVESSGATVTAVWVVFGFGLCATSPMLRQWRDPADWCAVYSLCTRVTCSSLCAVCMMCPPAATLRNGHVLCMCLEAAGLLAAGSVHVKVLVACTVFMPIVKPFLSNKPNPPSAAHPPSQGPCPSAPSAIRAARAGE